MNTALEVKEDGQIWLIPECPVEPKIWISGAKYGPDYKQYEQALASAERLPVDNQEVARQIIMRKSSMGKDKDGFYEPTVGVHPIPGLQYEIVDNTYIHEGSGKYWEDEPVKMKRLLNLPEKYAIVSLPESDVSKKESSESPLIGERSAEEIKTAREILYQVDKDGLRKYWIGTFGTEKKMDLKQVYLAMEEYAAQFKAKEERLPEATDELYDFLDNEGRDVDQYEYGLPIYSARDQIIERLKAKFHITRKPE